MINPNSIHEEYEYIDEIPSAIKLDQIPVYDRYDFDLADDKSFENYIRSIERDVRNSFEYRQMINFLRDYMDMNRCAFYEKVSNADTTKIRIEIHHAPFTLSDITRIVYSKRSSFGESLEEEMVAKEIMWLHYNLWVGLIPLSETVHELVHNQYLFVPSTKVFGRWTEFYNRYKPYMTPEQIENIEDIIEASNGLEDDRYKTILSKKYIYVNTSDAYELPTMEEVANMLKAKIGELMENPPEPVERPKEYVDPLIFY